MNKRKHAGETRVKPRFHREDIEILTFMLSETGETDSLLFLV